MSVYPTSDLPSGGRFSRHPSPYLLEWPLRPWWRAVIFLTLVIALSGALIYQTARVALATQALESLSIPEVQKGLQYDPANPDVLYRLGVLYSFLPAEVNPSEAMKYLRQAIALNPRRWEYWSVLGTTCDFVGDTACSDQAFERVQALNPVTPRLQWTMGNHYVLTNRVQLSFPYFRRLLEMAPEYTGPAFRLLLRAANDPQQIYEGVLAEGKDPSRRFAFLTFLSATGDYDSAMRIWGEMIAGPDRSPEVSSVKPFLDFLIGHDQIHYASIVWDDLDRRGLIPKETGPAPRSLVYNGSFGRSPLDTGFDWQYSKDPDLLFDFSDPSGYKNGNCLRIEFLVGRNENFELVSQVVRVAPKTRYQLTAYVRSDDLTSDSGPRLRVAEIGCQYCQPATADQTLGTTDWHPIDLTFTTQPQTQAVRITFWRPPGRMPPRDISGTVWLDEVDLHAAETPGRVVTQERPR